MHIHYEPYDKHHYVLTSLRQKGEVSIDDLQLIVVLFRAIHAPKDLSGWNKTIVMLQGHIENSLLILRELSDTSTSLMKQLENLSELIRLTASVDDREGPISKNPVKGRIAKHPIYAAILQEKSNFTSSESMSYVSIFISLLVLMRIKNVQKTIQDGGKDTELREVESRTLRYLLAGQLKAVDVEPFPRSNNWHSFIDKLRIFAEKHHLVPIFDFLTTLGTDKEIKNKRRKTIPSALNPQKLSIDRSGKSRRNYLRSGLVSVFEDIGESINSSSVTLSHQEALEELYDAIDVEPSGDRTVNTERIEFAVLYGSQLSVQERQLLQLRPNILSANEIKVLIDQLKEWFAGPLKQRVVASFYTLSAVSSKPRNYLENISISKFPIEDEPDYINLQDGCWYRSDVNLPNAISPDGESDACLYDHSSILRLPLPDILISGLNELIDHAGGKVFRIKELINKQTDDEQTFFEELRKKLHRAISEAGIRKLLFNRIALDFSPGFASLLLANTEFMNPTHLYYLSIPHKKLMQAYEQTLSHFNLEVVQRPEINLESYAGSRLCIDKEWVTSLFTSQYQKLIGFSYDGTSPETLIDHHNNMSCYTILVLMFNAMHRPRVEFGFEHFSIDLERRLLIVADKLHFADSTIRYVPLSLISKQQLESYFAHLRRFAKAIKPFHASISDSAVTNSKHGALVKTTLFSIVENGEWQSITIAHIRDMIGETVWSLPDNALRHFMCSACHELGYGDVVSNFLGHAGSGEHVCDTFSLVSLNDIASSSRVIDEVFAFLNIQYVKIDKPKERPVTFDEALLSDQFYIPSYLRVLDSKDKNTEEIAKTAFFKYKEDFNSGHLTPDEFVEACDKELEKQLSDNPKKSHFGLAKHQLNSLLLNHFSATRSFPSNIRFFQLSTPSAINIRQLADVSLAEKLRNSLSKAFIEEYVAGANEVVLPVLLVSQLIHGGNLPKLSSKRTAKFLATVVIAGDFVCLQDMSVEGEKKTYLLDSITSVIAIKFFNVGQLYQINNPVKACNVLLDNLFDKSEIGAETEALLKRERIRDVATLGKFLSQSGTRFTTFHERAYSSGLFSSTAFDPSVLKRLVTGAKVEFVVESKKALGVKPQLVLGQRKKGTKEDGLNIIKKINDALNDLEQSPIRKSHFLEMKSIWADVVHSKENTRDALLRSSDGFSDALVSGLYYLTKVAERNANKERQVAVTTLKTYLSKVIKPLVCLLGDERFLFLDEQEYIDIYRSVIAYRKLTEESKGEAARRIRDFHNVLVNDFGVAQVDWFRIEPSIAKRDETVSANIITHTDYELTFELIKRHTPKQFVARVCLVIFTLSNRGGLRIDDLEGLKVNDFEFANGLLHVKTNHLRRLKTVNSNRIVPVGYLINEQEEDLIREQISYSKTLHPKHPNPPLFCAHDDATRSLNLNRFAWYLMNAIKLVAGDQRLGTHDGRHSFCNYMICLFSKMDESGVLTQQLKQWFRTNDLDEVRKTLGQILLGKEYEWDTRSIYAISAMLGHASPITTFKNYFHMMHFIQHANNERWLSASMKTKALTDLTDMSFTNLRQVIRRGPNPAGKYRSVLIKVLTQKGLLVPVPERVTDGIQLPPFTTDTGLSSSELLKMDLFIKLVLKGHDAGDIADSLKLNEKAVVALRRDLASVLEKASGLLFGEIINTDQDLEKTHHYTFEFVHDPFFKSMMVKWASLIECGDVNSQLVTREWRNNLIGDVYIVENPDNNVIIESLNQLGLLYKIKKLGPTKLKWLQMGGGYELEAYRSKESDRSWTRKYHYLMLLTYLLQRSSFEISEDKQIVDLPLKDS